MYINSVDILKVGKISVKTVDEFKYLGLISSNRDVRTGKKVSAFRPSDFDTFPDYLSALET